MSGAQDDTALMEPDAEQALRERIHELSQSNWNLKERNRDLQARIDLLVEQREWRR